MRLWIDRHYFLLGPGLDSPGYSEIGMLHQVGPISIGWLHDLGVDIGMRTYCADLVTCMRLVSLLCVWPSRPFGLFQHFRLRPPGTGPLRDMKGGSCGISMLDVFLAGRW